MSRFNRKGEFSVGPLVMIVSMIIVITLIVSAMSFMGGTFSTLPGATNDTEQMYSYVIFKSGATTVAKNMSSGVIDYSSTNASSVIQHCLDVRSITYLKAGNYDLTYQLVFKHSGGKLLGAGLYATYLRYTGTNPEAILVDGQHWYGDQIIGIEIKDINIHAGGKMGLHLNATTPFIVSCSNFENIWIQNASFGLYVQNAIDSECYKNTFKNIFMADISQYGIWQNGAYNHYEQIQIVGVKNYAYAISSIGLQNIFTGVSVDGVIWFADANSVMEKVTIETVAAIEPPSFGGILVPAFLLLGYNSIVRSLTLINVDPARCSVGIETHNGPNYLEEFRIWGSFGPTYAFILGGSGVIMNPDTPIASGWAAVVADQYLGPGNWTCIGNGAGNVTSYGEIHVTPGSYTTQINHTLVREPSWIQITPKGNGIGLNDSYVWGSNGISIWVNTTTPAPANCSYYWYARI